MALHNTLSYKLLKMPLYCEYFSTSYILLLVLFYYRALLKCFWVPLYECTITYMDHSSIFGNLCEFQYFFWAKITTVSTHVHP